MQNNNKVSVIVPVYKAEKYIRKCIESILNQTYYNIELLLIDDGSPDGSGKICDAYSLKDKRVITFHQQNGGVSSARNFGLDRATGKWILFVDSDDWLDKDCVRSCVEIAENNRLDLLQFAYKRTDDNGNVLYAQQTEATEVLNFGEYVHSADKLNVCVGGTLFDYNIINKINLRFDTGLKLGEDQLFIYRYAYRCSRLMKISETFYNYRCNPRSATAISNPNDCLTSLKAFQNFELRNYFEYYIQLGIYGTFLRQVVAYRILPLSEICKLIKIETFDQIKYKRKLERLFPLLYKVSKHLAILYLYYAIKLENFKDK